MLNLGVTEDQAPSEQMRTRLSNEIALFDSASGVIAADVWW